MAFKKYFYVKKQQLSRYLALQNTGNRVSTPLQTIVKTLQANKFLQDELVALEVFGFIGTSTSLDYAPITAYLELWEVDRYYAKHAKKLNPKATVVCGDSVAALSEGKVLRRDYNFVVIDSNISSALNDGSFESFGVFENTLQYLNNHAVIVVTIYNNLKNYAAIYNMQPEEIDPKWIAARKQFYQLGNVIDAPGMSYLSAFEKILKQKHFEILHSQFVSRNDCVGFGVFVLKKNLA